jgi:hypothetical protein
VPDDLSSAGMDGDILDRYFKANDHAFDLLLEAIRIY